MAPPAVTLADYLAQTRRILHDPNAQFWSTSDLTAYINQGVQRRDLDTGGNRQLVAFDLTSGMDTYSFTDIGVANVFDVVAINLIFVANRIVLDVLSFSELNAMIRQWVPPYSFYPVAWARYGPNQVVFGPAPSQDYSTEWDVCVYSPSLVALTDEDALPYPYTEAVPYYAAYVAKLNERQYTEANDFLQLYQSIAGVSVNARTGMVPSMYPSLPGRR